MDFLGLGFGEILMIIVIALLLFGPNRIPEIARTLGRTVRAFRQATSGFSTAVQRELNMKEIAVVTTMAMTLLRRRVRSSAR